MSPLRRALLAALALGGLAVLAALLAPGAAVAFARSTLYSPYFPVVLLGLYAVRPLLAWPITALSVVVGFRYGVAIGLPVALAGAVATSLIPYAAARYLRTDVGLLGRVSAGSERFFGATGDLRGVVAARLAPTPAEVISVAAGIARVSVPAFVIGTAIGELPWTLAAVVAGDSMRRLAMDGVGVDPGLVVAGLLVAGLLLAGPAYRHLRARGEGSSP